MLDYLGFPHGNVEVDKFVNTVDRDPDGKTLLLTRFRFFCAVFCLGTVDGRDLPLCAPERWR